MRFEQMFGRASQRPGHNRGLTAQPDERRRGRRVGTGLAPRQDLVPQEIPRKPDIGVRRILPPGLPTRLEILPDHAARNRQERSQDRNAVTEVPGSGHARQARQASAPQTAVQDRFSLIVRSVRQNDEPRPAFAGDVGEKCPTHPPCPPLDPLASHGAWIANLQVAHNALNATSRGELRDEGGILLCRHPAEIVPGVRHEQPAWPLPLDETAQPQQKGHAVGTTGDGHDRCCGGESVFWKTSREGSQKSADYCGGGSFRHCFRHGHSPIVPSPMPQSDGRARDEQWVGHQHRLGNMVARLEAFLSGFGAGLSGPGVLVTLPGHLAYPTIRTNWPSGLTGHHGPIGPVTSVVITRLTEDLRMQSRLYHAFRLMALALLLPFLAGGCSMITTVAYLVAPEKDAPAEFKGLRGKHVAVVCKPIVELEFSDASSARELSTMVGSQLSQNVRKSRIIDQREVARWIDENAWVDYPTLGRSLDADIVVGIDLEQFRMHEGSTLYRGRATAHVRVYDVAEKTIVFEKRFDDFTFPGDSAVPATDQSEAQFRALFLQVLSRKIARSFHAYDSRTTFAEENLTF